MTHPRRKKTVLSLLPLAVLGLAACLSLSPSPARAADDGVISMIPDARRSLLAAFGEKRLILEAPVGMCFLDESIITDRVIVDEMRAMIRDGSGQMLIAAFVNCRELAALGKVAGATINRSGIFVWRHADAPVEAGTAPDAYAARRAAEMPEQIRAGLSGYVRVTVDEPAAVTPSGAVVTYSSALPVNYQLVPVDGVTGSALVQGVPVDITLTLAAQKPRPPRDALAQDMEKLLAQQLANNAVAR